MDCSQHEQGSCKRGGRMNDIYLSGKVKPRNVKKYGFAKACEMGWEE